MHVSGGGPNNRGKRPMRPKIQTRLSSKQGQRKQSRSSSTSSPDSAKALNSSISPITPATAPAAAPEIPGNPRSNRRESFTHRSDGAARGSELWMTRPSADFLMSIDLHVAKNNATFASRVPIMPQMATPTRMGTPGQHSVRSFDDLVRKAEYRPGEGRLVDEDNYTYMVSNTLAKTLNSDGVELTILDQLQPLSGWAKIIPLDADGEIPVHVRREFNLMFKADSPLRPRAALKTQDKLYILMPEMFGNGLDLCKVVADIVSKNNGEFTAALPVVRHTMEQLLEELSDLHDKNIYHRDIKLDNLLFNDDGTTVLTDFGSAHEGKSFANVSSTPAYCAPSHYRGGPIDAAKADVFALGASLFVLYSGQMPFLSDAFREWRHADIDYINAAPDMAAYRSWQTDEGLLNESLEDKRAKVVATELGAKEAITDYKDAHEKMTNYVQARLSGSIDEPLPDLGRSAWTNAFARLVQRDFAVAPLLVGMLAPTNKARLSAQAALDMWNQEQLGVKQAVQGAIGTLYKEHCDARLQAAQLRSSELIDTMQQRLEAKSPLFDDLQLENQPTVASLEEAKSHILQMAADVYHSVEEVLPGSVRAQDYQNLAAAKQDATNRRPISAEELADAMRQVREATPPKITPVSNVRGVKRIRDLLIKIR